jgi:hypothetical protein
MSKKLAVPRAAPRGAITLALVSRRPAAPGKPRVPRPAHHLLPQPTEDAARLFLTSSAHAQRSFVRASRCANSPNIDTGLRAPQLDRIRSGDARSRRLDPHRPRRSARAPTSSTNVAGRRGGGTVSICRRSAASIARSASAKSNGGVDMKTSITLCPSRGSDSLNRRVEASEPDCADCVGQEVGRQDAEELPVAQHSGCMLRRILGSVEVDLEFTFDMLNSSDGDHKVARVAHSCSGPHSFSRPTTQRERALD